jgi:hypothetical protein
MNYLTIRTIVTLCLIVATTIQPMTSLAVAKPCGEDDRTQVTKGTGCRCCNVEQQNEACCCCNDDAAARSVSSDRNSDSQARQSAELKPGSSELIVSRRCTCRISAPPMDRGNARDLASRALPQRLASRDFIAVPRPMKSSAGPRGLDATPGSRDDYCQRFLCVWRI